jgi:hypothetical protein
MQSFSILAEHVAVKSTLLFKVNERKSAFPCGCGRPLRSRARLSVEIECVRSVEVRTTERSEAPRPMLRQSPRILASGDVPMVNSARVPQIDRSAVLALAERAQHGEASPDDGPLLAILLLHLVRLIDELCARNASIRRLHRVAFGLSSASEGR